MISSFLVSLISSAPPSAIYMLKNLPEFAVKRVYYDLFDLTTELVIDLGYEAMDPVIDVLLDAYDILALLLVSSLNYFNFYYLNFFILFCLIIS